MFDLGRVVECYAVLVVDVGVASQWPVGCGRERRAACSCLIESQTYLWIEQRETYLSLNYNDYAIQA